MQEKTSHRLEIKARVFPTGCFSRKSLASRRREIDTRVTELAVTGVIPRTKCGREAGFRFDQPFNHSHLAASKGGPANDGSAPCGRPSLPHPRRHARCRMAETAAGGLARFTVSRERRTVAVTPMRAVRVRIEAATCVGERVRSAANEPRDTKQEKQRHTVAADRGGHDELHSRVCGHGSHR